MVSDTLSPIKVEITLDAKMEKIERIEVTDPHVAGDWLIRDDRIVRRAAAAGHRESRKEDSGE